MEMHPEIGKTVSQVRLTRGSCKGDDNRPTTIEFMMKFLSEEKHAMLSLCQSEGVRPPESVAMQVYGEVMVQIIRITLGQCT